MNKDVIKGETNRRDLTAKVLAKYTISDLMKVLSNTTPKLTESCEKFIVTTFGDVKKQFDSEAH